MSKQFLAVLAAIVLVFVGIIAFSGSKNDSSHKSSSSSTLTEHVTGNTNSSVTLVEYGDYQCPYCQQYYQTVKQVVDTNKDKIKFQFRNFPLNNIHQNAFAAARAAEAAGMQNRYWEMHDMLYETINWQIWTRQGSPQSSFETYAKQLGLNLAQFKTDFASEKVNNLINADMAEGNRLGITGTPTFFLDGKQIQVANDPQAFQKILDAEIAKKAPKTTTSTAPTGSTQAAEAAPAQ
jgi:protein-disulfide isomerase